MLWYMVCLWLVNVASMHILGTWGSSRYAEHVWAFEVPLMAWLASLTCTTAVVLLIEALPTLAVSVLSAASARQGCC
jgi:hypothetical protein